MSNKVECNKGMNMNSANKLKWGLCSVAVVLTAMGLSFAWKCPLDCVFGVDSGVFLFKRQLIWSAIGVGACFVASLIPWNIWLKLAPWVLSPGRFLRLLSFSPLPEWFVNTALSGVSKMH